MTAHVVAAVCLVVAAVVIGLPTRTSRRRLRAIRPGAPRTRRPPPVDGARAVAVLGGVSGAVLVGGWLGVPAGLAVGIALDRGLRRLEPRAARADRMRLAGDLPLAADLLAAALRAGSPVDRAADSVGAALTGPLGERLRRVARALRLGTPPDEAWRHLDDAVRPSAVRSDMRRVGDAAIRSSTSGAALSDALGRLAEQFRTSRHAALEAAARRAGVLVVLPLGLCFLPAFVLAGLLPVIVAVLGDVL